MCDKHAPSTHRGFVCEICWCGRGAEQLDVACCVGEHIVDGASTADPHAGVQIPEHISHAHVISSATRTRCSALQPCLPIRSGGPRDARACGIVEHEERTAIACRQGSNMAAKVRIAMARVSPATQASGTHSQQQTPTRCRHQSRGTCPQSHPHCRQTQPSRPPRTTPHGHEARVRCAGAQLPSADRLCRTSHRLDPTPGNGFAVQHDAVSSVLEPRNLEHAAYLQVDAVVRGGG